MNHQSKRHLLLSAMLLLLAAGITAFVTVRLPKRLIAPARHLSETGTSITPFQRYLSQFTKKDLPFSIDNQHFNQALDQIVRVKKSTKNNYEAFSDSIRLICSRYLYFPDTPRMIDVTLGYWREKDTLPGDYILKKILSDQYIDMKRSYGLLIPLTAFETPRCHATLTFVGFSYFEIVDARITGNYRVDYFDKTGQPLGSVVIGSFCEEFPYFVTGSLDSEARYKFSAYKSSAKPDETGHYTFQALESIKNLPGRMQHPFLKPKNDFLLSMAQVDPPSGIAPK